MNDKIRELFIIYYYSGSTDSPRYPEVGGASVGVIVNKKSDRHEVSTCLVIPTKVEVFYPRLVPLVPLPNKDP